MSNCDLLREQKRARTRRWNGADSACSCARARSNPASGLESGELWPVAVGSGHCRRGRRRRPPSLHSAPHRAISLVDSRAGRTVFGRWVLCSASASNRQRGTGRRFRLLSYPPLLSSSFSIVASLQVTGTSGQWCGARDSKPLANGRGRRRVYCDHEMSFEMSGFLAAKHLTSDL